VVNYYEKYIFNEDEEEEIASEQQSTDVLYPTMTDDKQREFDSAFRITFAGDLILLEDQVKRAYNGKDYDFTDVFEYAKPYISSADLAIGVFEGPMAGAEAGYSTGNFDDNKELYLNFPDSFAQAVKDSGFDLVTTANNHLLDKGEKGAMRTLDVLDKLGLDHTGSYRSAKDKQDDRIKIIEKDGLKLAVLSYTYGSNYVDNNKLIEGEYSYITSVASGMSGEVFEKLEPRRLFPVSRSEVYITLLDEEGVETALIKAIADLNADSAKVIRESLDDYYLVPHITRIISTEEKYGTLRWVVETDRGIKNFDIRNRNHDIKELAERLNAISARRKKKGAKK
jgi:hypothetical protein